MKPDISKLVTGETSVGSDEVDTQLLRKMNDEAKAFLMGFDWCKGIRQSFFGDGIGGIVAIFLVEIVPASSDVDKQLWVVVGDVPPAYLVTDEAPDARTALNIYIELMRDWINAVEKGLPIRDLIPVNSPATQVVAASLKKRFDTIEQLGLCGIVQKG